MRWPAWLQPQPLGPVPWWFRLSFAGACVALGFIWFDYLVNWRWVLAWLTGGSP